MAVIARKRANDRIVYWVAVKWKGAKGGKYWQRSGTDIREARRLNKRLLAEVKAGTFHPKLGSQTTVRAFAEDWMESRQTRDADNDASILRRLVLAREWLAGMRMEDVRPRHALQLHGELLQVVKADGERVKPKYAANVIGLVATMFQAAYLRELIPGNPIKLPRGTIKRRTRAASVRLPYSFEAIRTLLGCAKAPPSARVFAALAFYTGMREGEVCGRRWRDWDRGPEPLSSLRVHTQYEDQPLKTDDEDEVHARMVPVHQDLEQVLAWWWQEGWALQYGRAPAEGDFIVPQRDLSAHTRSSAYKMFRRALAAAGVDNQTLHATRHSFITHARRGGAPKDVVEKVTHNARGDILDTYTHFDWAPLCEAVACLNIRTGVTRGVTAATKPLENGPGIVEALGIEVRRQANTISDNARLGTTLNGHAAAQNPRSSDATGAKGAARQHLAPDAHTLPEVLRDSVLAAKLATLAGDEERTLKSLAEGADALVRGGGQ